MGEDVTEERDLLDHLSKGRATQGPLVCLGQEEEQRIAVGKVDGLLGVGEHLRRLFSDLVEEDSVLLGNLLLRITTIFHSWNDVRRTCKKVEMVSTDFEELEENEASVVVEMLLRDGVLLQEEVEIGSSEQDCRAGNVCVDERRLVHDSIP